MTDVYRIITAEGHEHDFHGGVARLKETHPGAVITGRRVINAVGEGSYEPCTLAQAQAAETAAAKAEEPVNYKRLKVDELKDLLGARKLLIPDDAKKDDLIAILEANDAGDNIAAPADSGAAGAVIVITASNEAEGDDEPDAADPA